MSATNDEPAAFSSPEPAAPPDAGPPVAPSSGSWQFSLRSFFILITLLAIALGWFLNGPERERRASERIRAAGGTLGFDVNEKWFLENRYDSSQGNGWLPREYTEPVKWVSVSGQDWKDAEMANLADLPGLEHCSIYQGPTTKWIQGAVPSSSPASAKKVLLLYRG